MFRPTLMRPGCVLALVLCWLLPAAAASYAALPAVSGRISGLARPLFLPELPDLKWEVSVQQLSAEGLSAALTAEGPDSSFRLEVLYRPDGSIDWRLVEGRIGLARWLEILNDRPELKAIRAYSITGEVVVAGHGTLRNRELTGEATAELRDGRLYDPASGLTVEGIAGTFKLTQLVPLLADAPQTLTFDQASVAGIIVRHGVVKAHLAQENVLEIDEAGMEVLGGRITVDPFKFSLLKPVIEAQARFSRLRLEAVVQMVPTVLASAEGQLSGRAVLRWSVKDGPSIGDVRLKVEKDAPPIVRLAPKAGLLTAALPPRFELLPRRRFGWLAWLFSINDPAHESARRIELGETRLNVDSLRLSLNPRGDRLGRTLALKMVAHPTDQSVVSQVTFDVNVKGPLQTLVQDIGLKSTARISAH